MPAARDGRAGRALDVSSEAQQAAAKPGERRQFLTCPIVRDTRTQPCWLAEYEGAAVLPGPAERGGRRLLPAAARAPGAGRGHGRRRPRVRRHPAAAGEGVGDAGADARLQHDAAGRGRHRGAAAGGPNAARSGAVVGQGRRPGQRDAVLRLRQRLPERARHQRADRRRQARRRGEGVARGGRRLPRGHAALGRPDADRARRTWAGFARARSPTR